MPTKEHTTRQAQSTGDTANVTEHDIARRAFELFLARNGEHGHDVDDRWQAEYELRAAGHSTAA